VRGAHNQCGFDGTQTDPLEMLRELEGWVEYILRELRQVEKSKLEDAERKQEAERRYQMRQAQKTAHSREAEARRAASIARAQTKVVKRVGKPVMFRSKLIRKKSEEAMADPTEQTEDDINKADQARFFS